MLQHERNARAVGDRIVRPKLIRRETVAAQRRQQTALIRLILKPVIVVIVGAIDNTLWPLA